jgi:hypothetical protein
MPLATQEPEGELTGGNGGNGEANPKAEAAKSEGNPKSEGREGGGQRLGQDGREEICQPAQVEKSQPVVPQKVEGVPGWAQTFGF